MTNRNCPSAMKAQALAGYDDFVFCNGTPGGGSDIWVLIKALLSMAWPIVFALRRSEF